MNFVLEASNFRSLNVRVFEGAVGLDRILTNLVVAQRDRTMLDRHFGAMRAYSMKKTKTAHRAQMK